MLQKCSTGQSFIFTKWLLTKSILQSQVQHVSNSATLLKDTSSAKLLYILKKAGLQKRNPPSNDLHILNNAQSHDQSIHNVLNDKTLKYQSLTIIFLAITQKSQLGMQEELLAVSQQEKQWQHPFINTIDRSGKMFSTSIFYEADRCFLAMSLEKQLGMIL